MRERGDSLVAEGGEGNALNRIWKTYGIVPEAAYPGVFCNGRRNMTTSGLIDEISRYLAFVKSNNLWDEGDVLDPCDRDFKQDTWEFPAESSSITAGNDRPRNS